MIRVIDALKFQNIDANFIGQKVGECKSKYVVVKNGGTNGINGSNSVGSQLVDIIFFVPQNTPTQCNQYKTEVKNILKEIDFLIYTGTETAEVIDPERKAITFSIMYKIIKKLEG